MALNRVQSALLDEAAAFRMLRLEKQEFLRADELNVAVLGLVPGASVGEETRRVFEVQGALFQERVSACRRLARRILPPFYRPIARIAAARRAFNETSQEREFIVAALDAVGALRWDTESGHLCLLGFHLELRTGSRVYRRRSGMREEFAASCTPQAIPLAHVFDEPATGLDIEPLDRSWYSVVEVYRYAPDLEGTVRLDATWSDRYRLRQFIAQMREAAPAA